MRVLIVPYRIHWVCNGSKLVKSTLTANEKETHTNVEVLKIFTIYYHSLHYTRTRLIETCSKYDADDVLDGSSGPMLVYSLTLLLLYLCRGMWIKDHKNV